MSSPAPLELGDALDALVGQFADPWSFLRELIQNAIDAGSLEIDVFLDHDPAQGMTTIEVVDNGEGMDREIIDARLTRLFSSAKDGDYTKIGRFGIGFVSVFAIEPELVCVDTARAGEHWRVLFKKDRSFERILLHHPGEGTTVRAFLRQDAGAFAASRERAREVVRYWCRHAHVEIRVDGERISEPLSLESRCVARHEEEGTAVIVGLWPEPAAPRGYYHGGLTLFEEVGDGGVLPHLAFKIDSRFLEHTLTRDNVLRDDNFQKAMAIVERVAAGPLMDALFDRLEALAAAPPDSRDRSPVAELYAAAARHLRAGAELSPALRARPVIPTLGGPALSLRDCAAQGAELRCDRVRSPVTETLAQRGRPVLDCAADDPIHALVVAATGRAPQPANAALVFACAAPEAAADPRWHHLANAARWLLAADGHKLRGVAIGTLAYPGSPVADRVAVSQRELGELTPTDEASKLSGGLLGGARFLVLNASHPFLCDLIRSGAAAAEPELAAYLLLKQVYLRDALSPERDGRLAARAAEGRCRRSTS
ncbi:MAG: ATP-binding protein [Nannocystaceae bacterium]